jgi:uncharacterized protein (DUF983 family)
MSTIISDLSRPAIRHVCRDCKEYILRVSHPCPDCGTPWAGVRPARFAARVVIVVVCMIPLSMVLLQGL